jgi:hypothetical protein
MKLLIKNFLHIFLLLFFMSFLPFLNLYSFNFDETLISDFFYSFGIFFIGLFFIFILLSLLFKSYLKSASVLVYCYFVFIIGITSYRYLYINNEFCFRFFFRARYYFLFILITLFIGLFILINRRYSKMSPILRFLNLFFVLTLLVNIYRLFNANLSWHKQIREFNLQNVPLRKKLQKSVNLDIKDFPDIYYIILDTHPSFNVLNKYFNYDSTFFLHKLEDLGFKVLLDSKSSYDHTYHSIPSTLNMDYIFKNKIASYLLKNNNVKFVLQSYGYEFINIPSSWGPVKNMGNAGFYVLWNEFLRGFIDSFFKNTKLRFFTEYFFAKQKYFSLIEQLKFLEKKSTNKSPKFVLAHFLCPHEPIVFNRSGEFYFNLNHSRFEYLDQLVFFDNKIINLIEEILNNSKNKPIIILQSDHGPGLFWESDDFQEAPFDLRFENLTAIHMSKGAKNIDWDNFSTVNTFRIILNHIFNTNLDLLKYQYFNYS